MSAVPHLRGDDAAPVFLKCIERIEDLVDQEIAALSEHRTIDLQDINHRKSRALLELSRFARMMPDIAASVDVRGPLERLHDKLRINRGLLEIHIAAVREVAGLIEREIIEGESDGTYSERHGARAAW